MVIVKFVFKDKENEEIAGFHIEGHANFTQKGHDIVCSAISVLAQTAIIGLCKYLHENSFEYSIKDGYLNCKLQNKLTADENKAAQILLTTMYLGIQSIEESYASHVRILKEV